ncbi:Uncharacterized protein ALO41_02558, partial [Pseudomonas amygdali pv. ulmi]
PAIEMASTCNHRVFRPGLIASIRHREPALNCKRTCIQPLRPAIERNRPGLNATEKPMIYRPSDSGLQELG